MSKWIYTYFPVETTNACMWLRKLGNIQMYSRKYNQYKQDRTPFVLIQLGPCCDWTWKFGKLQAS